MFWKQDWASISDAVWQRRSRSIFVMMEWRIKIGEETSQEWYGWRWKDAFFYVMRKEWRGKIHSALCIWVTLSCKKSTRSFLQDLTCAIINGSRRSQSQVWFFHHRNFLIKISTVEYFIWKAAFIVKNRFFRDPKTNGWNRRKLVGATFTVIWWKLSGGQEVRTNDDFLSKHALDFAAVQQKNKNVSLNVPTNE